MGIPSRQIGWSNESNLLYNIIKQLKFLTEVASKNTGGTGGGASISDAIYSVSWNADTTQGASRNAIYDKFVLVDAAISSLSNSKQNNISLTTIGTTGAATLVGSVLNIPEYSNIIQKHSETFGNGASSIFTITHSFGTTDYTYRLKDVNTGEDVSAMITDVGSNSLTINFGTYVPTINQFRITLIA